MAKRIAIYGSTGSIGVQALQVIEEFSTLFEVVILTAHNNTNLLITQAKKFKPAYVVLSDEENYEQVKSELATLPIKILTGTQALNDIAASDIYDVMVAAIVGYAGLASTITAIQKGKTICLANKETLVVAGDLIMEMVKTNNAQLIPIDSEHSAIFQCLVGEDKSTIEKIILTASGGPFLGKKPNFLINVKKEHALQHPNWNMGAKITIDSATLMNKGLEMIEAKWLFNLKNEQIEIIIHAQSIIHSLVQFTDGSLKAQLGMPDMKVPIQYALTYPNRSPNQLERFSFKKYAAFNFEQPDIKTFKNLALAMQAMHMGGNAPCILNAANEIAVEAFLKNKVGFLEMSDVIDKCLQKIYFIQNPTLHDYIETNHSTREYAASLINNF